MVVLSVGGEDLDSRKGFLCQEGGFDFSPSMLATFSATQREVVIQ
jgi:hypothetical protein